MATTEMRMTITLATGPTLPQVLNVIGVASILLTLHLKTDEQSHDPVLPFPLPVRVVATGAGMAVGAEAVEARGQRNGR